LAVSKGFVGSVEKLTGPLGAAHLQGWFAGSGPARTTCESICRKNAKRRVSEVINDTCSAQQVGREMTQKGRGSSETCLAKKEGLGTAPLSPCAKGSPGAPATAADVSTSGTPRERLATTYKHTI